LARIALAKRITSAIYSTSSRPQEESGANQALPDQIGCRRDPREVFLLLRSERSMVSMAMLPGGHSFHVALLASAHRRASAVAIGFGRPWPRALRRKSAIGP